MINNDNIKNNVLNGQLRGPFDANYNLYTLIENNAATEILYVDHLGIQVGDEMVNEDLDNDLKKIIVYINDEPFQIGHRGVLEFHNARITSIYFNRDVNNNSIIDYTIFTKE